MKKQIFCAIMCTALSASLFVGCSNQLSKEATGKSGKEITEGIKEVSSIEDEEEAWKKEPAYGQTIKIGYNGGLCQGAFGIAQAKGFYEAEGLKAEIVQVANQSDALGTAQVDVAGDHIATLLVPAVNGVNMKFTTGCHTGCKSLYALANSEIEKTSDLVGKAVAIPEGIGLSDHNITMRFFNYDNVDPNSVKYKVVSTDAVIQALQNGEVQAATLSDQFAKKFLQDGTLKVIRSLTFDEDFSLETCCVHAMNSDFIEKNPITAKKLTRAHQEASNWIEENKEEFVDIMLENSWASGEKELVLELANSYNFKITDEATETTLRNIINDYKTFGLIDAEKDTQELLDQVWAPVLQE